MIHQQYLMDQVYIIDILMDFMMYCESDEQQFKLLNEVRRIRNEISHIEEMTKTERQRERKTLYMTIESRM